MTALLAVLIVAASFGLSTHAQQPARPTPPPVPPPADVEKPPADATKTASGLSFKVLQAGTGKVKPDADDLVTVHYTGWTTDGKSFDSTSWRSAPSTFPVNRVIKGWGEGVQLMVVGERRRFWIPNEIAYNSAAGRPSGMLVFDVEMMEIDPSPPPDERQYGHGALHGMDHRRKDVRQLAQ